MNKKKFPKAIRPTVADTSGVGPKLDATAPDTTAPARPADSHDPEGKSEATMAKKTAGPVEPGKYASIGAKETALPDPEGRRASAVKLVERFSLWSGAAGLIPVPFVDLAAVGGLQIQMLRRISQIYRVPFSENRGKALIASLAGSMIPASSGIGAASIIKGVPVVGTIVSGFLMPALSASATYAIGMVFIQHFTSGGTLLDFNPPHYREFIKAQKELWSNQSGAASTASKRIPTSQLAARHELT